MTLKIARVQPPHYPDLEPVPLPSYQTDEAAGMDLCADVGPEGWLLKPGGRYKCPTGLRLEIPRGYEGQVRPRSGLAFQSGITVVNAPGTIDSDYRGELLVSLVNLNPESMRGLGEYRIKRGERIAQLVIAPVVKMEIKEVPSDHLTITGRGDGGFGSTGKSDGPKKIEFTKEVCMRLAKAEEGCCVEAGTLQLCAHMDSLGVLIVEGKCMICGETVEAAGDEKLKEALKEGKKLRDEAAANMKTKY